MLDNRVSKQIGVSSYCRRSEKHNTSLRELVLACALTRTASVTLLSSNFRLVRGPEEKGVAQVCGAGRERRETTTFAYDASLGYLIDLRGSEHV